MKNSQDVYLLHNCVYYKLYGHYNAFWLVLLYFHFFQKIIVVLDSSYISTYKTTPSSSFYTVYYQRYSDYKNCGERWRPSWISPRKSGRNKWKHFLLQSFRVNISEKSQLFKIYRKKSQNDTMPYTIIT